MRLRAGPQDLPFSWPLTIIAVLIYLGAGVIASETLGENDSLPRSLVYLGVHVLALVIMLRLRAVPERLPQTLLAQAGTGTIMGLVIFGVRMQADPSGASQPFMALIFLAVIIWSVAIDAHIYSHALKVVFSTGILIVVGLFGLTYIIDWLLFVKP